LPAEKRRAIWAIYAFCRTADDIVDNGAPAGERISALDDWRERLINAYGGHAEHPVMVAFADSAARFAIPMEPAIDLLRGARSDVTVRRYQTYDELLDYCYLVASTVGLLTAPVLGYEDGALPYGVALGRAMQLTNILRDVGEDASMGRIYLPEEDMRRFGYTECDLLRGTIDERFVGLMRFQIARVRALYRAAAPGIDLLSPASRQTVRIASSLYRQILDEIERNGFDVFHRRAFVPIRGKVLTAMMTVLGS
jgi:phytoene synthase